MKITIRNFIAGFICIGLIVQVLSCKQNATKQGDIVTDSLKTDSILAYEQFTYTNLQKTIHFKDTTYQAQYGEVWYGIHMYKNGALTAAIYTMSMNNASMTESEPVKIDFRSDELLAPEQKLPIWLSNRMSAPVKAYSFSSLKAWAHYQIYIAESFIDEFQNNFTLDYPSNDAAKSRTDNSNQTPYEKLTQWKKDVNYWKNNKMLNVSTDNTKIGEDPGSEVLLKKYRRQDGYGELVLMEYIDRLSDESWYTKSISVYVESDQNYIFEKVDYETIGDMGLRVENNSYYYYEGLCIKHIITQQTESYDPAVEPFGPVINENADLASDSESEKILSLITKMAEEHPDLEQIYHTLREN